MRELDEEHKSAGNETGSFPFSKGSDAATFARASKERSMPHSLLDGQSFQGTVNIISIILSSYRR